MSTQHPGPNKSTKVALVPARDLAEIVAALRRHAQMAQEQSRLAREIQQLRAAARMLEVGKPGRAKAAEAATDLALQREQILHANNRERLAQRSLQSPTGAVSLAHGFETLLTRLSTGQSIDEAIGDLSMVLGPQAGAARDVLDRVTRHVFEHWEALVLAELEAIAHDPNHTP